jgi:hypothetical protein
MRKYIKVGGKYCVEKIVRQGEVLSGVGVANRDTIGIMGVPSDSKTGRWGWSADKFRLYNPPKPEQTPERIHHDNPLALLTDKQLAELDRVTSGEREE